VGIEMFVYNYYLLLLLNFIINYFFINFTFIIYLFYKKKPTDEDNGDDGRFYIPVDMLSGRFDCIAIGFFENVFSFFYSLIFMYKCIINRLESRNVSF
jgi:hypothetical protein